MPTTHLIVAALASAVGFAALVAAPAKVDPRKKLETAIPEAIRLLEAKEYKTFLKMFVAPDDFKKLTKEVSLDEFAQKFGKNKSDDLLRVLKSVKGKEPAFDSEKRKATFKIEIKDAPKKSISFVKIDNLWYIQN